MKKLKIIAGFISLNLLLHSYAFSVETAPPTFNNISVKSENVKIQKPEKETKKYTLFKSKKVKSEKSKVKAREIIMWFLLISSIIMLIIGLAAEILAVTISSLLLMFIVSMMVSFE